MEDRKSITMSAIDNAPFGFAKLDSEFRIIDLNFTLAEMLSVSRDCAIGAPLRDFVPEKIRTEYDRALEAITRDEARVTADIYLENSIGDFACKLTGNKFLESGEEFYYMTLSDMSELKMFQKLLESERMLEESLRMASVGVIAGGLTHEINQPLNAICIATDGIMTWNEYNGRALPEPITRLIGRVSVAAQRIDSIVKKIRLYWASDPMLAAEIADPADLIETAILMIKQKIFNHEIQLEADCPKGIAKIRVMPSKFEMIISNLALNSIHSLDKSDKKEKRLAIKLRRHSDKVEITISDNGAGLQEAQFEKLFDPIGREKSPSDGSDLGLAIAEMFARQHEGSIRQGDCSDGEEFILEFPLAVAEKE